MGHSGVVQSEECFGVVQDVGVQGVDHMVVRQGAGLGGVSQDAGHFNGEQNLEHGVVAQGTGQQDEVRGQGYGGVVQGAKGGHVTEVEGHGGVVRGSELAMHKVLSTGV